MAESKKYILGRWEVTYRHSQWGTRIRDSDSGMLMDHHDLWDLLSLFLKTEPDCDHGYADFMESCDEMRKELYQFFEAVCDDMDSDAIELSKIDGNCVFRTMTDTKYRSV